MRFEVYLPCEQLLPYIRQIIISENDDAASYTVLPDTNLVMGFQYRGRLSYLDGGNENLLTTLGITGLLDTYRVFQNTAGVGSVLVKFRENGAACLVRTPLHELFCKSLSLEHFFSNSSLHELEEQLVMAPGDLARVRLVEDFLISHLQERPPDLLVQRALEYIKLSKGTIRMQDLASRLNISASPLEKRFRAEVGSAPKKFATIVRARHVISAMEQDNQHIAEYLSSFYDQSHFIRYFKKFAGVTPEQFLKGLL